VLKKQLKYVCQKCGYTSHKWLGRCPSCFSTSSFIEEVINKNTIKKTPLATSWVNHNENLVIPVTKIKEISYERYKTEKFKSFNEFLDGGIVKGSVNLFAGEPGIGKSTFLLQLAKEFTKYGKVLYVSGEESIEQISLRAKRLNVLDENILVVSNNNLISIKETIEKLKPAFLIIDSIQTMYLSYLESSGPSSSQSFILSGEYLDGSNVSLTAPSNYEISLDDTTFSNAITITAFDGSNQSIYVRLITGLSLGDYNGEIITITGGGDGDGEP